MPLTEGITENAMVTLAGKQYPVSRVITEQVDRFIEMPDGEQENGSVWELIKDQGQRDNPAFVKIGERWITGHTEQKRFSSGDGRPERRNIFVSDDGSLRVVLTSERITV